MLAKREIRHWPVAGALAARGGALFIDRDRLRALPATVDRIAAVLRAGGTVAVFPEGSTWCGRAQGRFRRAVFQAALDADACVQPVRIRYRSDDGGTATAPAFVGEDALLASVWRVAVSRGLVAEVNVRPALAPDAHPDRRALARAAQRACADMPEPRHAVDTARAGTGARTAGRGGAVAVGARVGALGGDGVTVGAGAVAADSGGVTVPRET
jgi:1-acyl-sn-glycerol-3-phosphate acyltransferase